MAIESGDFLVPLLDAAGTVYAYKVAVPASEGDLIVPCSKGDEAAALKVVAMRAQDDRGFAGADAGSVYALSQQDSIFGPCVGCDEPSSYMAPRLQCGWPSGSDCSCYMGLWWYQCNPCFPEGAPNPLYFYFEITSAVFSGYGASGKCSFTSKLLGCYPASPVGVQCGIMTPKETILAGLGF